MPVSDSPNSYQQRFLGIEEAESYAEREYAPGSYASIMWILQQPFLRHWLGQSLQRRPDGVHLDFACGTGRITRLVETIFPRVDAVDISASMVEIARKSCAQAHFFVGNLLEESALCPGPYASITTFRLLLNLDPGLRDPILRRLHERLEEGGVLILNNHGNLHSLRQPAILWKRWMCRGTLPRHLMLNTMSCRETLACLDGAGFKVETMRGVGVLPPTVYRWPLRKGWIRLDAWLSSLSFLQPFCIDLIFSCKKGNPSFP